MKRYTFQRRGSFALLAGAAALALGLIIPACTPEAHKEVGEVRNVVQSMNGTWKLSKAVQTDEDAARKGFPFRQLDLTQLFPYTDFQLTLNSDAGVPSTYSSVQGSSPALLKSASGSWTVDDPNYPSMIILNAGAQADSILLGGYPVGARQNLSLTVNRKENNKLVMSYTYEFTKQP